jgi:hypothetical protein
MSNISIKTFDGGLQDNGAGAPLNQYKVAQNFRLTEDSKLETNYGTVLDDSNSARYRTPTDANSVRRISTLIPAHYGALKTKVLFKQIGQRLYYNNGTANTNLQFSATDAFSASGVDADTRFSFGTFLEQYFVAHSEVNQRPIFFFNGGAGTVAMGSSAATLRTAGLPYKSGAVTYNGEAASGSSYLYAYCYKYTYSVNGRTFVIRSRPYYDTTARTASTPATTLTVTNLQYTNGTDEKYDTANAAFVIEAYRTANNGSVFYYVGECANTATTITVSFSTSNITLYTTGGVTENWRPPTCKFVHATTSVAYYAHGYDLNSNDTDNTLYKNRLWQSKPGQPHSVPQEFYCDVEEDITGISSVKSIPIVFTDNYIYRVDGALDSFGRGSLIAKRISEATGCVNHNSIVQTVDGVYFAGKDGFYFTDGFNVTELSRKFRSRYSGLVGTETKNSLIYGAYNPIFKEVHWTCKYGENEGTAEANCMFTFNTERGTFTGPHTSGYNNLNAADGTEDVEASLTSLSLTSGSYAASVPSASVTGAIAIGDVVFCDQVPFGTRVASTPIVSGLNLTFDLTYPSNATTAAATAKLVDGDKETWMHFQQLQPTALAAMNNILYYSDPRGYTFYFSSTTGITPVIDNFHTDPANWKENPIRTYYASIDTDFGIAEYRKWVNKATVKTRFSGNIQTNLSIVLKSENDGNGLPVETPVISRTTNTPWGYPGVNWGSTQLFSTYSHISDSEVYMPQEAGLRCTYKSIHITNGTVKIQNSGDMQSEGTFSAATSRPTTVKTITISASSWDGSIVGYYLKFFREVVGEVSYLYSERIFWVLERLSDTTINVWDPENDLVAAASEDFEVWGIRKGDVSIIQEVDLNFEILGGGQSPSSKNSSSEASSG